MAPLPFLPFEEEETRFFVGASAADFSLPVPAVACFDFDARPADASDGAAASISATRIDAHPANAHPATDCLHYCMPGPVDAWTHALFHLLATKPLN